MDAYHFAGHHGLDLNGPLRKSLWYASTAIGGVASDDDATSRSATLGLLNVYNGASANAGENTQVELVAIRLTANAVNTSATDFVLEGYTDTKDRYSSGGSTLTPGFVTDAVLAAGDLTKRTTEMTIKGGELVLAAADDETLAFRVKVKGAIFAVDDQVTLLFGSTYGGDFTVGSDLDSHYRGVPAVLIGPGCSFSLHEYGTSQSADPKFQIEVWGLESKA